MVNRLAHVGIKVPIYENNYRCLKKNLLSTTQRKAASAGLIISLSIRSTGLY